MKIKGLFAMILFLSVGFFSYGLRTHWKAINSPTPVVLRQSGNQLGALKCLRQTEVPHYHLPTEGISAEDFRYIVATAWPQRIKKNSKYVLFHSSYSPTCLKPELLCESEGVSLAHCMD